MVISERVKRSQAIMARQKALKEINSMDWPEFSSEFANIIEDCQEAAEFAYSRRPFTNVDSIIEAFRDYMDSLDREKQIEILKNHPMLGTKKTMTINSVDEQKSAGLQSLPKDKDESLVSLNEKYFAKFGFPFIVCVKTRSQSDVFAEINRRLLNERDQEIKNACHEVKQINYFRIKDLVKN